MIEIILENLDDKSYMATNINIKKLYNELYKKGALFGRKQKDGASLNARKNLPEICFSRSEFLPQKTGVNPTQNLSFGNMIKIVLNMDNVKNIRNLKKPYPVSYGYFNKEKADDTELRGEERIQIDKIPADKKYMTIYLPSDIFDYVPVKMGPLVKDGNQNVKNFLNSISDADKFKQWIDDKKKEGLIKSYEDTSRKAHNAKLKRDREAEERASLKETIIKYAGILNEDTPQNYINQLIKKVLSKSTTKNLTQAKNNYLEFNKKRKNIETTRVERNTGKQLSKEEFIRIGLDYFNNNFKTYSSYKQIVIDALNDYY